MSCVRTLVPFQPGALRGWRLTLDGVEIQALSVLTLVHPRFGELKYGWAPEGYDTWTFAEQGGGGSVIVPYVIVGRRVLVGVVRQLRRNQGGEVWNCPRGFIEPGELHRAAAFRELIEETGLRQIGEIIELRGEPGNPNSAFFETLGGGIRFFAVAVTVDQLEPDENYEYRDDGMKPRPDTIDENLKDRSEGIRELRFYPWTAVARLGDLLSVAAVGRLLAHLEGDQR